MNPILVFFYKDYNLISNSHTTFDLDPKKLLIYRNNLYQVLLSAYLDKKNRQNKLNDAKYWLIKFQEEYGTA